MTEKEEREQLARIDLASDTVKEARRSSGLPAADFARALGYRLRNRQLARQQIEDLETGRKPVTGIVERLCLMFLRFGIPDDFLDDNGG